jgi:hypothetical protein
MLLGAKTPLPLCFKLFISLYFYIVYMLHVNNLIPLRTRIIMNFMFLQLSCWLDRAYE